MTSTRISGIRSRRVILGAVALLLAALPAVALAGDPPPRETEKSFDLKPEKADAVFALLAPDDVKVLVRRTPKGIGVRGTPAEVRVLNAFCTLLTREEGRKIESTDAFIEALKPTWDTTATYKLPEPKAEALIRALAFADVPVLVSPGEDGVTVEAAKADQQVIKHLVKIMKGEEIAAPEKPKRRIKPDKPAKVDTPAPPARPERVQRKRVDAARKKATGLEDRVAQLEKELKKLTAEVAKLSKRGEEGKPRSQAAPRRRGPGASEGQMIDRRYRLPKHHADHLFALFAPDDITDIVVSREGNQVVIRATEKDHNTIKRLVEILTRNDDKPKPPKEAKEKTGA